MVKNKPKANEAYCYRNAQSKLEVETVNFIKLQVVRNNNILKIHTFLLNTVIGLVLDVKNTLSEQIRAD